MPVADPKPQKSKEKKRKYTCRNCGDKYEANPDTKGLRVWCSEQCGYELALEARNKLEKIERKVVRAANRAEKLKQKSLSYFEKKLRDLVQEIARLIDHDIPCISCGNNKKRQGGHYHTHGGNKTIAFNLHNIHIQDYHCNVKKAANIIGYDEGLIREYGRGYWEMVKFDLVRKYPTLHATRDELIEWANKARAIRNKMKKNPVKLSPDERLELREWVNSELGIYK